MIEVQAEVLNIIAGWPLKYFLSVTTTRPEMASRVDSSCIISADSIVNGRSDFSAGKTFHENLSTLYPGNGRHYQSSPWVFLNCLRGSMSIPGALKESSRQGCGGSSQPKEA
jgi:hypothetical protein